MAMDEGKLRQIYSEYRKEYSRWNQISSLHIILKDNDEAKMAREELWKYKNLKLTFHKHLENFLRKKYRWF